MPFVLVDRPDPGVAVVTLNRPERMNAMAYDVMVPFRDALLELGQDNAVRAVVVTGAGSGFCSGADQESAGVPPGVAGVTRPTYALRAMEALEDRGTYFIKPGDEVYEGQVVGQHIRDIDLGVNVTKRKVLNNIRSSTKEAFVTLKAARNLSLDDAIEYISEDELVEVTPKNIRLRKRVLDTQTRQRQEKRARLAEALA